MIIMLHVSAHIKNIVGERVGPSGLLPFHEAGRKAMQSRFAQLSEVMTCALLTNYPSSSPGAYAWVQCMDNKDCLDFFKSVNLTPESGVIFGSTSQCKRLQECMALCCNIVFPSRCSDKYVATYCRV